MKANQKRCDWLAWLIGILLTSAMFVYIMLRCELRYAGNDDALIMRPFMGFDCTQLPDFHLYLHPILLYPLRWLSLAVPGVAWFSWMQLALMWFAGTLSVKAIVNGFQNRGRSPLWGALTGACYLAAFAFAYCCNVTYTVTAGMLGAAAVLQVLSVEPKRMSNGQVLRALLLALVPVVLAYGLRQITAVPILAFCALAFGYVALSGFGLGCSFKRSWKPLFAFLLIVAVVFGGLVVGRELEIKAKGMGDYLRWQRARISVMDYEGFAGLTDEDFAELGWTPAERDLVYEWYFLDRNISAEAFEKIAEKHAAKQGAGLGERLLASVAKVLSLRELEPLAWRTLYVLGCVLLLCFVGLLVRRRGALWQWLCLLCGLLLCAAMLLYLGLSGRLPLRAALMAVLPLSALVFGLLPSCLPEKGAPLGWRAVPLVLLGLGAVALCACYAVPMARDVALAPVREESEVDIVNPFADLDEFAAENPEYLIIYDESFASDARMFPSTEYGTPHNVMFWGGWGARSPEYMQRLAAFDIDGNDTDATIFLREDVYLARGRVDNDPDALCQHISELCGSEVYYQSDTEWGGVHLGQFFAEE